MDQRSNSSAPPLLQIGDWRIDASANELHRGAETARIEPKAMAVLVVLADASGGVVTREALLAKVWPGVIVGDEALTQTIIKLRRALGDNSRTPSYIETIAKRGYRLVAPVQPVAAEPSAIGLPHAPPAASARGRTRRALVPWLVATLLVLGFVAAYFIHPARVPEVDEAALDPLHVRRAAPITVTVMPFESLSTDGEQAYLARGISTDLTTDLAQLPDLLLISPSGGTHGERIGSRARYLVQGSVQRESHMLRINIRLIDTETDQHLWSERYERPFGDLFALQDEIVGRLAGLLPGKLAAAARQRAAHRYTRNFEAYDYFLRAQALFLARQPSVNEEARALYRKALELDPKFARAYAGLAMTYAMDQRLRGAGEASNALGRAFELAESARLIDPGIPEVYWALAFVHVQSKHHPDAIRSLQKAIELNRSYADAYAFLGGIHTYRGNAAKSVPLLRTALRLNPDGGYLYFMILGRAYFFGSDVEQAIINLREAAARNPADIETRIYLAASQVAAGDRSAAEWEAVEIRALAPGFSTKTWLDAYPLESSEYRQRLVEHLAQAGL